MTKIASYYELTEEQVDMLIEGLIQYAATLMRKGELTTTKINEIDNLRTDLGRD